jgi:hypothetical protein
MVKTNFIVAWLADEPKLVTVRIFTLSVRRGSASLCVRGPAAAEMIATSTADDRLIICRRPAKLVAVASL